MYHSSAPLHKETNRQDNDRDQHYDFNNICQAHGLCLLNGRLVMPEVVIRVKRIIGGAGAAIYLNGCLFTQ